MVSFSCEGCGDVLTKKKLDPHRSQCYGASFTCLDCHNHFRGTDYRSHTSCISEDQKYQGALYREKPLKGGKRKSVSILEPNEQNAVVPRAAYVEDAPDVDAPPHVPSPPPAVPAFSTEGVNVFDFLVTEDSPNPSRTSLNGPRTQGSDRQSALAEGNGNRRQSYRNSEEQLHSRGYEEHGYSYGAEPVNPRPYADDSQSVASLEFMTPAAKATRAKLRERPVSASHSRTNSGSEKKRKRGSTEDHINGTEIVQFRAEGDTPIADATNQLRTVVETPGLAHSGLTGGLTRLLSHPSNEFPFPPSPEDERDVERDRDRRSRPSNKHEDPASPLKRSRHSKDDSSNGLGISIKGRAGKVMQMIGGALTNPAGAHNNGGDRETASLRTRRRGSSSDQAPSQPRGREGEKRERKKHKVHRHNGTSSSNVRHERRGSRRRGSDESPEVQRRKIKAIEYYQPEDSGSESDDFRIKGGSSQMVVFGEEEKTRIRCESFLSYVTKGPDSEKGCSMNKALKRWHRDGETRGGNIKQDEEKELWRGLRLKKNDRGEIVVFF